MKYKMLVGEPDEAHQILFMRQLEKLGYPTDLESLKFVDNTDDLVEGSVKGGYDIIFIEYATSGDLYKNGIEAIEGIRCFDDKIPIVMATTVDKIENDLGFSEDIETVARKHTGANAVIKKPYPMNQLRMIMERFISSE